MSKRGYLTAEEYKLLRQSLGFSQEEAKDFHKLQNVRTIKRWESGDSWVSELACDKITGLFNLITKQINFALEHAEQAEEIILICYPEDCKRFIVGFDDLPVSVHNAMIKRLYIALREQGKQAHVILFDMQNYFAYLATTGQQDTQAVRSAWACFYYDKLINQ